VLPWALPTESESLSVNYAPSDELIQCQPLHTNHEQQLYGMMINSFVVVIECVTSDPNPAFAAAALWVPEQRLIPKISLFCC
jgi:TctA family transporter